MKKGVLQKICVFALLMSMVVCQDGFSNLASAAKKATKAPKLSASSVSVKVGSSKKVTLKNKPSKAKVTWSTSNKKVATVKNGKIKGVKKGSAKVTCKVVYKNNKKKVTKKLVVKVKVTKKTSAVATKAPTTSAAPSAAPSTAPVASVAPTATTAPVPTESPSILNATNLTTEHTSANGIPTKDNGLMRKELSSLDLIKGAMGPGWNLGNQMEQANVDGSYKDVKAGETSAGNPVATQLTFDGLKSYGVNTVRVPVAWSNFMSDDGNYTISEDLFNRVEEIINYALNDEMYVIINIHWDGGWWGRFGAEEIDAKETPIRDEAWKKYIAIWTQISERYKEYSDHLIFEGANEELSGRLNDDYQHPEKGQANQTGKLGKDANDIYNMVNQINQKFVDIVRQSGGNNAYRHLLIPGTGNESCVIGSYSGDTYQTDGTMDERYIMPTDTTENGKSKLSVSVHYYDPTDYGLSATSTTSWGYRDTWGTKEDYEYMDKLMGRMKKFSDQGYGIIMGECGCVKGYKDNIIDYLTALYDKAAEIGACAVLWDEGHYYERKKGYFAYGDVGQFFADRTGSTPNIPANAKLVYTGISVVPTTENTDPKVVYTWTGRFLRHTGDGTIPAEMAGIYGDIYDPVYHGIGINNGVTDASGELTDACTAIINEQFWNIHLTTDWSQFKEPCVRVYPDPESAASLGADLQVGYMQEENSAARFDVDYDQGTGQFWPGKYVKLDAENLKGEYPWLWLTTNTYTGCSFVKIEICDGAYNSDGTEFVPAATTEN